MANPKIELPYQWTQREDQKPLWRYLQSHIKGGRAVEVAHRQFGKDTIGMHFVACSAHERIGNYWHMLPKGEQSRKAIWESINPDSGKLRIDEAFPKELRKATSTSSRTPEPAAGTQGTQAPLASTARHRLLVSYVSIRRCARRASRSARMAAGGYSDQASGSPCVIENQANGEYATAQQQEEHANDYAQRVNVQSFAGRG